MNLIEAQDNYASFVERSKYRESQRRIIRDLFEYRQMKTSIFKHMNRVLDAEQRRDERVHHRSRRAIN